MSDRAAFITITSGEHKENLLQLSIGQSKDKPKDECVILVELAEKFKFEIQDEIQCYYWSTNQCTSSKTQNNTQFKSASF